MARLITSDLTYVSFPITKFHEDADGNLVVKGTVTDGSVDSDRQIVDPDFSAKALTAWMESGPNVRVMHSPALYPAGRGLKVDLGNGSHELESLVVEETAKKLVRNKVLRAYSVGIADPVIKRDPTGRAPGGIIVGGTLAEVSLVDRPANKNCQLVLAKSADLDVPWTYGDLEELLAQAEAADPVTKGKKDKKPAAADQADDEADDPGDVADGDADDVDDPEDNAPDAAEKSYAVARADWLTREPKLDGAPTSGTAFLAKRAQWQRWTAEGEAEGLDGTDLGRAVWAAKRDFDRGVGGGVDRDKLPAEDFGDPENRKYPIVTPGDVSDAAGLAGHAGNSDAVRQRITDIAHRKGPGFVAELPDSWSDSDHMAEPDVTKASKKCPKCGANHHSDSKLRRCDKCGKKLPKADTTKGSTVDKHNSRPLPPDVEPAGEHREPDGDQVELLEHDAGMPTDPDDTNDFVPASTKGKKPFPAAAKPFGSKDGADAEDEADGGADEDTEDESAEKAAASYTVKRMHDATCAAYAWDSVADTYPSLKGVADAIVPGFFRDQVTAAAQKGDMTTVTALAGVAQAADEIHKGIVEVEKLADARAMLHKSFTDMYPDTHLTPGAPPQPGQFQRPYLRAGHAPLNASGGRPTNVPAGSHTPDPDDFQRGPLTAGHQAPSPSNKGNNLDTGGSLASGAARTYYANASQEATRVALTAMHDHIAATYPNACVMAASKSVMPPDMRDTNRPHPVVVPPTAKAPGEKTDAPAVTKTTSDGLSKKQLAKLVKSAVDNATADVRNHYEQQLSALRAELDDLGAQPDPAQAPLRGAVRKAATTDGTGTAVAVKESLITKAQQRADAERDEQVTYLTGLTKSANPSIREQAENSLTRLLAQ